MSDQNTNHPAPLADDTSALDTASKGTGKPTSKRKSNRAGKGATPATTVSQRAYKLASANAVKWSKRYTLVAVGMSSALNAYSGATESSTGHMAGCIAAAAIGATVPLLVWMLGTVTAWTYRAGWRRLAYVSGAIACCVLALSVVHVSAALATLTGAGIILSALLAVGIDCGLVASEATAVLVSLVD